MTEEDRKRLKELRAKRNALSNRIESINNQVKNLNDQIDEIYFKDSGIDKYKEHLMYFELNTLKYLILVKDIKRLISNRVRIIGPSIMRSNDNSLLYDSNVSIDLPIDECINKIFYRDNSINAFINIQNMLNKVLDNLL